MKIKKLRLAPSDLKRIQLMAYPDKDGTLRLKLYRTLEHEDTEEVEEIDGIQNIVDGYKLIISDLVFKKRNDIDYKLSAYTEHFNLLN